MGQMLTKLICQLFVLCLPVICSVQGSEPLRSRTAFAHAMNKVKEGMPEAEVVALLGKPDAVSTEDRFEVRHISHVREIWRYGVSDPKQAATLGIICIDDQHRAQYISGQGTPIAEGVFAEPELRRLLAALYDLPGLNGSFYNPRPVIRAVNLLQPLGKEKALAAIDEFLRVSFRYTDDHAREGVFLLLRTLFEVPDVATVFDDKRELKPGLMPPIYGGAPEALADKKLLPRFPIAIEGDIPFLLVVGYNIGGRPQRPEPHVAYFRKFGRLRAKPLSPTARPFDALKAFEKSPRWYFKGRDAYEWNEDERERILLGNQVMRLLETVFQAEPDSSGQFIGYESEQDNNRIVAEASKLAIRWDSQDFKYTFLDGRSLPLFDPTRHPEVFWKPAVVGLNVEFYVKRESRRYVCMGLWENSPVGGAVVQGVVRVFNLNAKGSPLYVFKADGTRDLPGTRIRLDEGAEIQAEIMIAGRQSQRSPVFKP
jgi:hypothetical protein